MYGYHLELAWTLYIFLRETFYLSKSLALIGEGSENG